MNQYAFLACNIPRALLILRARAGTAAAIAAAAAAVATTRRAAGMRLANKRTDIRVDLPPIAGTLGLA